VSRSWHTADPRFAVRELVLRDADPEQLAFAAKRLEGAAFHNWSVPRNKRIGDAGIRRRACT